MWTRSISVPPLLLTPFGRSMIERVTRRPSATAAATLKPTAGRPSMDSHFRSADSGCRPVSSTNAGGVGAAGATTLPSGLGSLLVRGKIQVLFLRNISSTLLGLFSTISALRDCKALLVAYAHLFSDRNSMFQRGQRRQHARHRSCYCRRPQMAQELAANLALMKTHLDASAATCLRQVSCRRETRLLNFAVDQCETRFFPILCQTIVTAAYRQTSPTQTSSSSARLFGRCPA